MRLMLAVFGVTAAALLLQVPGGGVAEASDALPARWEGHVWLGHDTNLLDISDLERSSFTDGDPQALFAVDRMADQFWEGEVAGEWKAPRVLGVRPRVTLGWEHRHYLHNPIKSENHFALGLHLRPGKKTGVDLEAALHPQIYVRHRLDPDASPGDPQFRPEVYRRWDLDLSAHRDLGSRTTLEAILEGSKRRYDAPFEERDREVFGGGVAIKQALGAGIEARAGGRYRATWTRNEPWDPDDRSHRDWRLASAITFRRLPLVKSVSTGLDLEWRRFTSGNPEDRDHFGRRDLGGEAKVEIVRALGRGLDWSSRGTWRWRRSNFPVDVFDEEGVFEEAIVRTGVTWAWERS